MSSQEGRQFSCLGEPCGTSTNEPKPSKPGTPVKNEETVNINKLTSVNQIDPSIKNSLPKESDDPTGNNETLERSLEQEFLSKPPVNLSLVCDATRKRLLEADEEEKTTGNQSTSNSLRNISEHQNDVLRRPPERPTSLSLPRATAVRPVKRPSFLPIPLQFSSPQSNNCSHTVENDDAATSSPSESKVAYTRTIVSGRRVLQSPQTLLGSSLRIPFESQYKADSRQELGTVWEPLSPKDVGTCAPPWAPDHLASSSCMLCSARFSLIRAKQHCRACGRIVCAMCCTHWALLPYLVNPLPGLEQSANDVSMVGEDAVNTASENSSTPSSATTSPSLFQCSYSSPERYSRVCELCYGILTKYPTPVAATKPQTSSLIQPPSPKRQRSIPPSSSSSIRPSMTSSKHCDLLIDVSKVDLKQSAEYRSEDLLHPLHPVYVNAEEKPNGTEEEQWPPLVTSLHTKLSLHKNPPKDVLLARLSSNESLSRDCHHRNAQNSFSDVSTEGWPRFPVAVQDANHVAPVFPSVATCQSPSGITLALTRNVHLYVHATELRCCLRKPAWCFASFGLQSFGQQEVVLIVQRRPTEELPPLCVYRFYQRLYLAVSQQQQQKPTESIAPEMIALIPSHQSRGNLFRAYDTFIPHSAAGTQNGDCAQNDLTKFADNPTGLLYGCLFFHPTHQCLHGLHLPVAPFLVGHFFHQTEAYWAKYLPLRLLLRLGKSMRHYPTPLLCDLDRDPVFHFNNGTGVLPWLSTLTDPIPVVLENTNHLETIGPALLLRLTGLRIRLVSCPRSDTQVPGARLELLFPLPCHTKLVQFLETLSSNCTGFVLAGDLDPEADSHLVCVQMDSNVTSPDVNLSPTSYKSFSSSAISIANTARAFTGASFALFSPDSRYTTVSIVEDGVFVQLSRDAFTQLAHSLSAMNDVRFEVPSIALKDSLVSSVTLRWEGQKESTSPVRPVAFVPWKLNRKSWVDMQCVPVEYTYLVPISYQLVHWLNLYTWSDWTPSNPISTTVVDSEFDSKLAWARFHVLESTPRTVMDIRTGVQLNLGELANQTCGAVVQSLRSHINDLRKHNHTQLAVRIQMKPPDQVGYQVASVHSELDVLIPDGPRCTNTTEDTHSPKGTISFSPSPDPCDCSSDLECYLTPVIQSWLSRMQFDTGHLDSPSSSSISSLSPAVRTPTGPNSVGSVSEATSTPDCSPQLVIELDFYLLD